MAYRLYADRGSGSATTELALVAIGAPVEVHDVPLADDAQRMAAYAAVNPQRKLPTLVTPDGEVLTESAAILLTLAERHPAAGLLPADPGPRALAVRWLLFMATELYPLIEIIDYPERFHPDGDRAQPAEREALRERLRSIWKTRWALVEAQVAGTPWFLPQGFSLVDPYAAVLSRWAQVEDWRRASLPRIEGIVAAIAADERLGVAWRRHFAD